MSIPNTQPANPSPKHMCTSLCTNSILKTLIFCSWPTGKYTQEHILDQWMTTLFVEDKTAEDKTLKCPEGLQRILVKAIGPMGIACYPVCLVPRRLLHSVQCLFLGQLLSYKPGKTLNPKFNPALTSDLTSSLVYKDSSKWKMGLEKQPPEAIQETIAGTLSWYEYL